RRVPAGPATRRGGAAVVAAGAARVAHRPAAVAAEGRAADRCGDRTTVLVAALAARDVAARGSRRRRDPRAAGGWLHHRLRALGRGPLRVPPSAHAGAGVPRAGEGRPR